MVALSYSESVLNNVIPGGQKETSLPSVLAVGRQGRSEHFCDTPGPHSESVLTLKCKFCSDGLQQWDCAMSDGTKYISVHFSTFLVVFITKIPREMIT